MRIQEFRDARLLIHENHQIYDWSSTADGQICSVLDGRALRGPRISFDSKTRRTRCYWLAFAVWSCLVSSLMWTSPASASFAKQSAVDQVAGRYRIVITNPLDGESLPSMLTVASATLDTTSPVDSHLHSKRGTIFLTLHMSSGPVQRNY